MEITQIAMINWKIELKLKRTKYCVLSDGNSIIFTIKDTKLYVPVVTLTARDNKKIIKPS